MDKVKLKFFAAFRETTGQSELDWPLAAGQTAGDVLESLVVEYPALSGGVKSALVMVNRRYATRQTALQPGDEVAFLPPVGGG
ncbi:MAG: molybdopterin converting factor, subunit 1 [Chloroflexi bacterium]|jgi:MoaD family protein|nr:molybdopterin converting factor, subunit 1 [Chloroflexota bacterium]